jgi:hypothetical protein
VDNVSCTSARISRCSTDAVPLSMSTWFFTAEISAAARFASEASKTG